MGTEGWYNDEVDSALARWFDGERWTSHTLVKADWTEPGDPPPPVEPVLDPWIAKYDGIEPEPATTVLDAVDDDEPELWGTTSAGAHFATDDGSVFGEDDEYAHGGYAAHVRRGIDWARFAAPLAGVAALVLALLAVQLVRDDGGTTDPPTERTAALGDIDQAVISARRGLAVDVTDGDLKALIRGLCDVASGGSIEPVAADAAISVTDAASLSPVLAAAARGADKYCPAGTAAADGAIPEVLAAASLEIVPASTTTLPVDTTQASTAATSSSSKKSASSATSGSASASGSNAVTHTETKSQSSTSPSLSSNTNSEDKTAVGNNSTKSDSTNTSIVPPPPEATTTTTG